MLADAGAALFEWDAGRADCEAHLVGRGAAAAARRAALARDLARLCAARGFDGYLLNFEHALAGADAADDVRAFARALRDEVRDALGGGGEGRAVTTRSRG